MDLRELGEVVPEKHWYYRHKYSMLKDLLVHDFIDLNILIEIGAGSGFFCKKFVKDFGFREAYCVDPYYESEHLGNFANISYCQSIPNKPGDLYLYIDVLEHVEDPVSLIKKSSHLAKSGSKFIFSVPAFDFLWSGHDDFFRAQKKIHKRRHKKSRSRV